MYQSFSRDKIQQVERRRRERRKRVRQQKPAQYYSEFDPPRIPKVGPSILSHSDLSRTHWRSHRIITRDLERDQRFPEHHRISSSIGRSKAVVLLKGITCEFSNSTSVRFKISNQQSNNQLLNNSVKDPSFDARLSSKRPFPSWIF